MDEEARNILIGSVIAILFAVASIATGISFLLMGSWIAGAVTIIAILGSTCDFSIIHKILIPVGTILIIILTVGAVGGYVTTTYSYTSTYHDMYSVTAPFGIIWVDVSGQFSGGLLSFSGSINSQLVNSYIVKYMDGNQLKTITTEYPLVIDGTFTLEERWVTPMRHNVLFKNSDYPEIDYKEWVIHIPSLPAANQTNSDYRFVP